MDIYKEGLQQKRRELKLSLENNEYEETGEFCYDAYLSFIDMTADLEMALKIKNWENADEIADVLLYVNSYTVGDRKCAAIVYQLLEDADV